MASDPPKTARECAHQFSVSISSVNATWYKIRSRLGFDPLKHWKETGRMPGGTNQGDVEPLRNVSPDTMGRLLDMGIEAALRQVRGKLDKATFRDITSGVKDMVNARALIRGEPTQILRVDQRQNLKKLIPALVQEASKRGISFEVDGSGGRIVKNVTPQESSSVG
jgi:hypothetical protein